MTSSVIHTTARRRHETPSGVMTTLASPTLSGIAGLSLWEVTMQAGVSGPLHLIDSEQIWTVLEGELSVIVAGQHKELRRGDTIVIGGDAERQVSAQTDARLLVCGHGDAVARVPGQSTTLGTPPWIA